MSELFLLACGKNQDYIHLDPVCLYGLLSEIPCRGVPVTALFEPIRSAGLGPAACALPIQSQNK